jgi:hypothetical protein
MTLTQAILIGSVVISASVLGSRVLAPYEIAPGRNLDGSPIVWRLNVMTGKIEFCTAQNVITANHAQNFVPPNTRPACD